MYINDLEKPEIKGHQFTKIAGFLTDGGENKQKSPNYTPEQMPYSFKAYDDSLYFYIYDANNNPPNVLAGKFIRTESYDFTQVCE